MRILLAGLALAIATPVTAQEVSVRAGADKDGFVGAFSGFVTRGRPGGIQAEAILHQASWLEIPLLLHLDIAQDKQQAVYLIAGPSVTFDLQQPLDGGDRKARFSGTFGGGVEVGPFLVDARYTTAKKRFTLSAGLRIRKYGGGKSDRERASARPSSR